MYSLLCTLIVTLLGACSSGSILSDNFNAPAKTEISNQTSTRNRNDYTKAEGLYSNYDYAFSVSVPQGLVGCRDSPPLPNHGFGISLIEKSCDWMNRTKDDIYPKAYIYIDASYNSLEWKSFDEAIESNISYLKNREGISNVKLVQRIPTRLSRLPASLSTIHYKSFGEEMVEDILFAFRNEKSTVIVYTICLTVPATQYDEQRKFLVKMQKTWRLQQIP